MHNYAAKIAYDGSSYYGWQKTPIGDTIEGVLQDKIEQILQKPTPLQAASRTDRGVHAEGQWINFLSEKSLNLEKLLLSLNALLPPSIRVLSLYRVPLEFHPTLHAERKEYHYQLCTQKIQLPQNRLFSWHIPRPLDLQVISSACRHFVGEHDFSTFCNFRKNLVYKDKIRRIESLDCIESGQGQVIFRFIGNHFLYKMVRTLTGTLVDVGLGKIEPEMIPLLLKSCKRPLAGVTAPAHGLTLKKIYYPQIYALDL